MALAQPVAMGRSVAVPAELRRTAGVALSVAAWCAFTVLVGLFGQFSTKALVVGVIDIGHAVMLAIALGGGAVLARPLEPGRRWSVLVPAALAGAAAGAALAGLAVGAEAANLRWMLVSLTPVTLRRVGFGLAGPQAALLLAASGAAASLLGAALVRCGTVPRRLVLGALGGVVTAGLLRELIRGVLGGIGGVEAWAFTYDGVLPAGAAAAVAIGAASAARPARGAVSRLFGRSGMHEVLMTTRMACSS